MAVGGTTTAAASPTGMGGPTGTGPRGGAVGGIPATTSANSSSMLGVGCEDAELAAELTFLTRFVGAGVRMLAISELPVSESSPLRSCEEVF